MIIIGYFLTFIFFQNVGYTFVRHILFIIHINMRKYFYGVFLYVLQ